MINGTYVRTEEIRQKQREAMAKGAIELIEAEPFIRAGYRVVFIWEDELSNVTKEREGNVWQ